MTVKATHANRPLSWLSQRAVRSDTEHVTCDVRYETAAGRSSFIHPPELPDHTADHPTPAQPTLPHKAVRGARARSS
eukprot:1528187-Prymnesium_polylepis.2